MSALELIEWYRALVLLQDNLECRQVYATIAHSLDDSRQASWGFQSARQRARHPKLYLRGLRAGGQSRHSPQQVTL
jgi:hypothetical protein